MIRSRRPTSSDKAGYKKDSNGKLLGKDGQPIQFTFLVQNGWTDWVAAAQVVQQNLNAFGMTVNVQTPSPDTITQQTAAGNSDIAFAVPGATAVCIPTTTTTTTVRPPRRSGSRPRPTGSATRIPRRTS